MSVSKVIKVISKKFFAKAFILTLLSTLIFPMSSARADKAFDVLAACINKETSTQVNIMFLIDSSGSLEFADDNKSPGSDPEGKRAEIIASSILLLERINQEKKLFFALTTFDSTSPGQDKNGKKYEEYPWKQANLENVKDASEWSEKIKNFNNGQKTDWAAGLRNAQKKLSEAPESEGEACQAIIWFTDGGIDVGGGPEDLKKSIRQLCGIAPGEHGVPQTSLITSIRELGIHLIGVFLKPQVINDKNRGRVSLFKPTVLGQGVIEPGDIAEGAFNCGEYPIPDSHGQGELIEVNNTDELAERFLKLTMQIIVGRPVDTTCQSGVTNFNLDPGIKDAVLLLPSLNWKISTPNGGQASRTSLPSGWNETTQLERFSVLNVPIKEDLIGRWSVNTGNAQFCATVFLDAGVQPRVNRDVTLTAGKSNQEISGAIINSDGSRANLGDFSKVELSVDAIDNTAQNRKLTTFPLKVNKSDSSWNGSIEPYSGSTTASLLLRLDLTTKSGVKLPTIKSAVEIPLVLPDQLCKLKETNVKLSDLYTKTPAKGTIEVQGPKQGDCLLSIKSLNIKQDPLGRSFSDFSSSIVNKNTGSKFAIGEEVLIKQGESVSLEISLASDISAKGLSKGLVLLKTRTPDSTQSMDLIADLEFASELTPPPAWLYPILTLIGILIPLGLLQLNNYFFARFRMGDIRIANVPVKAYISNGKVVVSRVDDQKDLFQDRNFDYPSSNTDSEKSMSHEWNSAEVFKLQTKLPKNPFGEVSGVLTFSQDRMGFASEETITDSSSNQVRVPLNPNGYWVVSASKGADSEDAGGFELLALVTVYLNIDPSQAESQFSQLKDQIETSEDSWVQLAKGLGEPAAISSANSGSGYPPSNVVSNKPQSATSQGAGWDKVDSPVTPGTISGGKSDSVDGAPKAKKKLFGKKKLEKSKESSEEPTQAPLVDPDDPWA
jgi:hypothetical protein